MSIPTFPRFSAIGRFRAAMARHGSDLRRWPAGDRARADALLGSSPEASELLDEAWRLDDALRSAGSVQDRRLWGPGEQDAALARLRAGVAARIAPVPLRSPAPSWRVALLQPAFAISGNTSVSLGWRVAMSGGLAVMAGLWLGWVESAVVAKPAGLLTVLQSAPFHSLGW